MEPADKPSVGWAPAVATAEAAPAGALVETGGDVQAGKLVKTAKPGKVRKADKKSSRAGKGRTVIEYLPDADEIERSPVPRFAQVTLHLLLLCFASFAVWASVSQLDPVPMEAENINVPLDPPALGRWILLISTFPFFGDLASVKRLRRSDQDAKSTTPNNCFLCLTTVSGSATATG